VVDIGLSGTHTNTTEREKLNINTILHADDRILMATSEDYLQKMAYHLNLIARKYNMIISSTKTKSMAMCGNQIQ
jgi:hypothetical protein